MTASSNHVGQVPRAAHTALAFQPSEYNKWKFTNSPTFLEVLEEFPSLRVSASFLLSQLPVLKPRYYSISSSRDRTPTEVHLTVAVLTYRTRGKAEAEAWSSPALLLTGPLFNMSEPWSPRQLNTHLPEFL